MPDLLSALGGTFSEESGLEKEEMWLDKQLLLSCRHGWVPAPVDFHHYILLSPSLLDAEDGNFRNGGPCWTRTSDTLINSQVLYRLSYGGIFVLALPIFPASHPASIVGACELNFCVRNGNRWTLTAINTNFSRKGSSPFLLCQSIPALTARLL